MKKLLSLVATAFLLSLSSQAFAYKDDYKYDSIPESVKHGCHHKTKKIAALHERKARYRQCEDEWWAQNNKK